MLHIICSCSPLWHAEPLQLICYATGCTNLLSDGTILSELVDKDKKYTNILLSKTHVITDGWDSYVGNSVDDEGQAQMQYDINSVRILDPINNDVYLLAPPVTSIVEKYKQLYRIVKVYCSPGSDTDMFNACKHSLYIEAYHAAAMVFSKYHFMKNVDYIEILNRNIPDLDIASPEDLPEIGIYRGMTLSEYKKKLDVSN